MARCAMCFRNAFAGKWIYARKCVGSRAQGVEAVSTRGNTDRTRRFFICKKCKKSWKNGNSAYVIINGKEFEFHK